MSRETISEQLQRVIRNSGLTYRQLEELTGVEQSTISRFVAGKRTINDQILSQICLAFDLELHPRNAKPSSK